MDHSKREEQVISLLLEGKSNKQIAFALGISKRTVEFHLGNIYAGLNVASRSEAIIKLTSTRPGISSEEPQDPELRQTTVESEARSVQNQKKNPEFMRRFPLKKYRFLFTGLAVLLIAGILLLVTPLRIGIRNQIAHWLNPTPYSSSSISTNAAPLDQPTATLMPREQIVAEERQLAVEYDEAVKAEIQSGSVEISTDPGSGKEVIHFTGDSSEKIAKLYDAFSERLTSLNKQYQAIYLADIHPTPFPTQSSISKNGAYYQQLLDQYPAYVDQLVKDGPTVSVYDPGDGIYYDRVIGDAYAKGEIMSDAIETLHQAPEMAKVNQEAFMAQIRQTMGTPDLQLTFQKISLLDNANGIKAAVFVDDTGTTYAVAISTGRLANINPALTSHVNIPAMDVKTIDEVRPLAQKFAANSCLRFAELKDKLLYEESSKGDMYFFRWDYRNKDWSGTPWALMPPFLQIGMSADGKLVTYTNTLDLF